MNKYKLLLINPEGKHTAMGRKFKCPYPSNSLLTVASLTPPEFDIKIVDETVEDIDLEEEADIIGITAMTPMAKRAYHLADHFRTRKIPVVLGGIHPSALPEEAGIHADAVVVGEAEDLWQTLLQDFKEGNLKKTYRNLQGYFPDLSKMPVIRRDMLDHQKFFPVQILETSRGCPNQCEFCAVSTFFGGRYRHRPLEDVEKEIIEVEKIPGRKGLRKWISPFPNDMIFFADSNLTANRDYALKLFDIFERHPNIWWHAYSTIDVARDSELLAKAAKAGCFGLGIGFETLSSENLKKMGKRYNNPSEYEDAVKRIRDHGIAIMGSFLVGLDDDGIEVFDDILEFVLEKAKLESCFYMIPAPLPGTRLYKRLMEEGRIIDTDWDNYDSGHIVYKPKKMSEEQLLNGFWRLWKETYNHRMIWRRVKNAPYFSYFLGMNYGLRQVVKQITGSS